MQTNISENITSAKMVTVTNDEYRFIVVCY